MAINIDFMIPALLGFCSGILPPLIIEKWKGKKQEKQTLTSIENDITNLQNSFHDFSSNLEKRLTSTEEKVRALEINLSHNTGVLKGQNPEVPLEDTTANIQTSFTATGTGK